MAQERPGAGAVEGGGGGGSPWDELSQELEEEEWLRQPVAPAPAHTEAEQTPSPPSKALPAAVGLTQGPSPRRRRTTTSVNLGEQLQTNLEPHVSRWTAKQFMLGSLIGQLLGLGVVAVVLVLGGAAVLALTHGAEGVYDASDFGQLTWFSWGIFFDPGTQTGLAPDERVWTKTVAVIFSLLGFVYNLTVLGLVVDKGRTFIEHHKEIHARIIVNNHILVIGWTDKTLFVLSQLIEMLGSQKGKIVVLGEASKVEMMTQIRRSFKIPPGINIRAWQGTPHEIDDMERVSIKSAKTIIVLGRSRRPSPADSRMLTVVLASQALDHRPRGNLIAEVRKVENLTVLDRISRARGLERHRQAKIIGLVASQHVDHMLAVSILQPDLGICFANLVSFKGEEMYIIDVQPGLHGLPFGEALRLLHGCVVVGVKTGGSVIISPSDDYKLQNDDRFIVVASDLEAALQVHQLPSSRGRWASKRDSTNNSDTVARSEAFAAEQQLAFRCLPSLEAQDMNQIVNPGLRFPVKIALLGWRSGTGTPLLLQSLDCVVPRGSTVVILSRRTEAERKMDLERLNIGLDGRGLSNFVLEHAYGSPTDMIKLRQLSLAELAGIIVVDDPVVSTEASEMEMDADESGSTEWAQLADAGTMSTVLLLDQMRIETLGETAPGPNIACECVDFMTQRILQRNNMLSSHPQAMAFHANEFQMGLLTMTAFQPEVADILGTLFDPTSRSALLAVAVSCYLAPSELAAVGSDTGRGVPSFNYWQLLARVRARRDMLVGWSRVARGGKQKEVVLNPPNKDDAMLWTAGDRLVIASDNYNFSSEAVV